jgi:hypothetical protein
MMNPGNPADPPPPDSLPWRYGNSPTPQPSKPPSPGAPGEFTRMFQKPASKAISQLPAPNANSPGEFTRMMNAPSAQEEDLFRPPSTPDSDLLTPRKGGPPHADDFSRVAGSSPVRAVPPSSKQTAASPAGKKTSGMLPLVLILAGLLIAAVILVVILGR